MTYSCAAQTTAYRVLLRALVRNRSWRENCVPFGSARRPSLWLVPPLAGLTKLTPHGMLALRASLLARPLLGGVRENPGEMRSAPPCSSLLGGVREANPGEMLALRAMKKSRPISRVLSWTAIHLANASPRRSSDLPGSRAGRTWPLSQPASLFGLAPGGVYLAAECCHRRGALLPHHFTLAGARESAWAVYFLLHFPWAHAPQALPGTMPWEPGLSSAR